MKYHADTGKELKATVEELGLIGLSITDIDTIGVASFAKIQNKQSEYRFATDAPLDMKLSDGCILAAYTSSYEDVYCGFDFAINPKREDYERDNDLDIAGSFSRCLNNKIVSFEVTEYGDKIDDGIKNIASDSPKELVIIFEDGTRMSFCHSLYDEYMYVDLKLPEN